ncbi:MAG: hypothetical protein KKE73_08945 [Proteobacteria bacterium]|nr:hypothetical protein [Pseudomonadota bacterium]
MNAVAQSEVYRGWTITLRPTEEYCARFAMTLTAPDGGEKHFAAAGDTEARALARGREVVDMELDHLQ